MIKIMWFCIPAHGHTNPTIEVVRELVTRGNIIRYYSFNEFKEKIENTGAEFISCDNFLSPLDEKSECKLRKVSTTEMTIKDFEITKNMDSFLSKQVKDFMPDIIVSDSVCFWGKLIAKKFNIPLVCSTTTFAFNKFSSKYMKYSFSETADMILGLPKVNKALKSLRPLGYNVKSALDIVQNKNDTDTIVFTSKKFQPCAETFDENHYCFVGPSVKNIEPKPKSNEKPLVYISLGTVINDRPEIYTKCIESLKGTQTEVIISCGNAFDINSLGTLPVNVKAYNSVNQMEVLSKANLFITHCGMNSVSESLYMGVPMLLYPLTGEQNAVARRTYEMGAGTLLSDSDIKSKVKLKSKIIDALSNDELKKSAQNMRSDFLSCGGFKEAANFIETKAQKSRQS